VSNSETNFNEPSVNEISIAVKREGEIPGTHIVKYESLIDDIEIKHIAHNRKGFALGALLAAEFIFGKKGIFEMSDLIKL
jgi:4-hydroxy-tetrahydrodipicolinate reductase